MEKVVVFMFLLIQVKPSYAFISKVLTTHATLNQTPCGRHLLESLFMLKNLISWTTKLTVIKGFMEDKQPCGDILNFYNLFI